MKRMVTALLLASGLSTTLLAEDWFRWRGPKLTGVSSETKWKSDWPNGEVKIAWKTKVGTGFSTMAVSNGLVYTMGNVDGLETVYAIDVNTGKTVWKHDYAHPLDPKFFEGGPCSTPTVDPATGAVYTLSRRGDVFCLDAKTGKVRWKKNVQKETDAAIPDWGFSGAPLVLGSGLVLNVGEAGMALDKKTGKTLWTTDPSEAGYSTPLPVTLTGGARAILLGSAKAYLAVDPSTGKEIWRHRWNTRYGVNAADPIMIGNQIFISSGYNKGSAMLQLDAKGQPTEIWKSKDLRTQMNPGVYHEGYVYGTDGNAGNDATLNCIDWKTGDLKWSQKAIGTGGVTLADGKLIVLTSRGELIVAPASPNGFKPISRAQVIGGKCWTVPVLSHGRIYCRNAAGDLVCVDVR